MPQVVSSAVWNCPPPNVLIALLEKTNVSSKVNHNTMEKMVKNFDVRALPSIPLPTSSALTLQAVYP